MRNGFYGTDEEWDRFNKPLLNIQPALCEFAKKKKTKLITNSHGGFERSIKWSSNNIERFIQVYSDSGPQLLFSFWICAYKDKDGFRFLKREHLKKAVKMSEIENEIQELLEKGYKVVESWGEEDLINVGKLRVIESKKD